jgi:hypothetical protein
MMGELVGIKQGRRQEDQFRQLDLIQLITNECQINLCTSAHTTATDPINEITLRADSIRRAHSLPMM